MTASKKNAKRATRSVAGKASKARTATGARPARGRASASAASRAGQAQRATKRAPQERVGRRPALDPARTYTVFLDRDGVFNEHPRSGVRSWDEFHWLPGVKAAFARLCGPGIQTCLVTNQPTVGMGLLPPWRLGRIHARMRRELEDAGGRLDLIEAAFAPFRHRRRKPRPGMLEDAARAFAAAGSPVDKRRAVMVGDKAHKDAAAAAAFGIPCILLATTYDAATLRDVARKQGIPVHAVVPDLAAAVDVILEMAR